MKKRRSRPDAGGEVGRVDHAPLWDLKGKTTTSVYSSPEFFFFFVSFKPTKRIDYWFHFLSLSLENAKPCRAGHFKIDLN